MLFPKFNSIESNVERMSHMDVASSVCPISTANCLWNNYAMHVMVCCAASYFKDKGHGCLNMATVEEEEEEEEENMCRP